MRHTLICGLIVVAVSMLLAQSAAAENWPGWRGPRGDGTSGETGVPVQWSADDNIAWKVELPYGGHACPVIWDDYVFLAGIDLEKTNRMLVALDRKTGKTLWERVVLHCPLETRHSLNSYASSTPACDGEFVYASFLEVDGSTIPARNASDRRPCTPGVMVVAAYDMAGELKWRVRPGEFVSVHGYCSNPVLYKNLVIVNGDHDGDSYLVALDRGTGETVWKVPRENGIRSYSTPIVREIGGRAQLMMAGNLCVASYDPRDGSRQWIIDGPTEQFVASVVFNQGLLFVTGGYPDKQVLAVDPAGSGNVTDSHVRWRHDRKGVAYVPSPVAAGKYFYVAADNGIGTCYDAASGEVTWHERLGRHYSGSLVATAEHVYFQDDDGVTKVVKVGPKFEVVAENRLEENTSSSPAISQGQFFVRGEKHLYCIGAKGAQSQP